MAESRDTVWEGSLTEEGREKARVTGRTRCSGFGDYICSFVRREVNVARGPVDLQVEHVALIVRAELFG